MDKDEFARWLPRARNRYAEDIARSGGRSDEEAARRKAVEDTEQLFPGDQPSPNQFVFIIEADGEAVGEFATARNLYLSLGYEENAILMSKPV